jgi:hypothetical protein
MPAPVQARIDDDRCVAVANQPHRGADPSVGPVEVPLEQDVDLRHPVRIERPSE